ncbi:MAG: hypothetical protein RL220_1566 [Bacteroidota bacterium]
MAHHDSAHQKTYLWTIFIVAVGLCLLFVQQNHSTVKPKPELGGNIPTVEKKAEPAHHEGHDAAPAAGTSEEAAPATEAAPAADHAPAGH